MHGLTVKRRNNSNTYYELSEYSFTQQATFLAAISVVNEYYDKYNHEVMLNEEWEKGKIERSKVFKELFLKWGNEHFEIIKKLESCGSGKRQSKICVQRTADEIFMLTHGLTNQ